MNDMQNEDEFYAEKADLIAQREAAEKRTEEAQTRLQELTLDTQLREAYAEIGGIGSDDDNEAYEAIKRYLKDGKMQFEKGQPVFVDNGLIELGEDGTPKSVRQKMQELKQHSTFKNFFSADTSQANSDSQQPKTFKREDAQRGKISIDDIASGKIQMENVDAREKPDFKVVSADKVANLKNRRWK
jgi:hypothetical protein